jgi:two-component system sensor histidine kinase YesM
MADMRKGISGYFKRLAGFKESRYINEFSPYIYLLLVDMAISTGVSLFLLTNSFPALSLGEKLAAVFLLLLTLIMEIGILRFIVNMFDRIVMRTSRRIEDMKKNNPYLAELDSSISFAESLNNILDILNTSMEKEYSTRLLQKQAEFDSMKSQINPHFLYNTLDSIRGQALMENASATADMIEILSRLFRYSISQKDDLITLEQELDSIEDYIKIQQYRFSNRFTLVKDVEVDDEVLAYRMPKLILQPIIENALYHGFNDMTSNAVITIRIYITQSRLIISVADNGCGMETEKLNEINKMLVNNQYHVKSDAKTRGSGIAVTNVNARIKLIYGEKYGITAFSTLGLGSEFQIVLPYGGD